MDNTFIQSKNQNAVKVLTEKSCSVLALSSLLSSLVGSIFNFFYAFFEYFQCLLCILPAFDFFMQIKIQIYVLFLPLSYTKKVAPYMHFAVTCFFHLIINPGVFHMSKNRESILILFLLLIFFFHSCVVFHCEHVL